MIENLNYLYFISKVKSLVSTFAAFCLLEDYDMKKMIER